MKTAHRILAALMALGIIAASTPTWEMVERCMAAPARMPGAKTSHPRPAPLPDTPMVRHEPQQPKSGQGVTITITFGDKAAAPAPLLLEYQVVDPGKYVARKDAAFEKEWTTLAVTNQTRRMAEGRKGGQYSVELPGSLQIHRRLIRYRIVAGDQHQVIAPDPSDAQPNFAYFVYDGVPDWKGAVDPDSLIPKVRRVVTYPGAALERVPVYHFLSSRQAIEGAVWLDSDNYGGRDRNAYKYTGTMVYQGIVYDHIGFRARGGQWRHAMGKNMLKFNFLPGHRFAARDFYGRPYKAKWDKLNLGACIQQGDYQMRGEQGMFEAVGFRLFNLAGLEAPETHWVHLRIIDGAEESPADQDQGDFWGLYLAVENVDEHFLKDHDLPAGNLYKIEFEPKLEYNGNPAITNQSDVRQFISKSERREPDSWWTNNVDLRRYYNYRSILECIHHYDVDSSKNYFYYLPNHTTQWIVVPWDIDLTWGDGMFGAGYEPFYRAGLLSKAPFKQQYQERLAEIRDLLFNPEQTGWLIDEYAAMIYQGPGKGSIADADRAKWDYNHIMEAPFVMPEKAGMGRFYLGVATNDFQVMVKYMKSYLTKRTRYVDSQLLSGYHPPAAPKIALPEKSDFSKPIIHLEVESAANDSEVHGRWRLAEITDPQSLAFKPDEPRKYEIQSLLEREIPSLKPGIDIPTGGLVPGHIYRIRVRSQDTVGNWSRWSAPAQFTVPLAKE